MLRYVRCLTGMAIAMVVIGLAVSKVPMYQPGSTAEDIATAITATWIVWQIVSGIYVSRQDKFPKSLWYIPALWVGGLIGFGVSIQVISIVQIVDAPTGWEFARSLVLAPLAFSIPGALGYISGFLWRHVIVKIWRASVPSLEI